MRGQEFSGRGNNRACVGHTFFELDSGPFENITIDYERLNHAVQRLSHVLYIQ